MAACVISGVQERRVVASIYNVFISRMCACVHAKIFINTCMCVM